MFIERLRLENYRGFKSLDLPLHPRLNVLIGPNGAGKSSVLRALRAFLVYSQQGKQFRLHAIDDWKTTIGPYASGCTVAIAFQARGASHRCEFTVNRPSGVGVVGPPLQGADEPPLVLRSLAPNRYLETAVAGPKDGQPIHGDFDLIANRFRGFIDWFRNVEDRENEVRLSGDDTADYRDRTLETVRGALSTFLKFIPGARYGRLRITRVGDNVPLSGLMMLEKNGQNLPLDAFSDGESTLILTVGDIARSLAEANPASDSALSGEGIVLIDGIELHLHPGWQRAVLPALTATFPGIQFIVTTHSPQVIGEVATESVISLRDFQVVPTPPTFGKDVNSILETVMGASSRDESIKRQLDEISALIDADDYTTARARIDALSVLLGPNDPDLIGSRAAINFLDDERDGSKKPANRPSCKPIFRQSK